MEINMKKPISNIIDLYKELRTYDLCQNRTIYVGAVDGQSFMLFYESQVVSKVYRRNITNSLYQKLLNHIKVVGSSYISFDDIEQYAKPKLRQNKLNKI